MSIGRLSKFNVNQKEIKLIIDNNILDEYERHYFTFHPRARKKPIEHPYHPSINQWMIMKRPMMNALKQKWKDFTVWFVGYCGYENLQIDSCEMIFTTYFKTKIRHDTDNCVPKFILDGLVDSGFIVDDDSKHLKSLTLKCDYDKENPRVEIVVKYDYEKKKQREYENSVVIGQLDFEGGEYSN